jgi:hypothetical protein
MAIVGVDGLQTLGHAHKSIDRLGGFHSKPEPPSISKLESCKGELVKNVRGARAPMSSRKSKGTRFKSTLSCFFKPRHVSLVRPSGDVPLVVIRKSVEAAR